MQVCSAHAQWIFQALIRTCAVSFERDGEALNAYLSHIVPLSGNSVRCDARAQARWANDARLGTEAQSRRRLQHVC
jgi:hypothetical protein